MLKYPLKDTLFFILGLLVVPAFSAIGLICKTIDSYYNTTLGKTLFIPLVYTLIFIIMHYPRNHRFKLGRKLSFGISIIPAIWLLKSNPGGIWLLLGFGLIGMYIAIVEDIIGIAQRVLTRGASLELSDIRTILLSFVISLLSFTFLFMGLQLWEDHFLKIGNPTYLFIDILYFNIVSFTTIGYGDIIPVTAMAKVFVLTENVVMFFHLSIGIGIIMRGTESKA